MHNAKNNKTTTKQQAKNTLIPLCVQWVKETNEKERNFLKAIRKREK